MSTQRQHCERCHGVGFIRQAIMRLDDVVPGEPQTVTVIEVRTPEFCPECGGSGTSDEKVNKS